ncbi:MAG: glycosyltransferase family 39 protein [Planctomycetota bacterium]
MRSAEVSDRTTWVMFLTLLAAHVFLAWREASLVGITIDERTYFHAGHIILSSGWTHLATWFHGPLPYYFNQLLAPPLPPGGLEAVAEEMEYIFWGRVGMLPFSILAASVVFLWSRRAFGNLGGLFSTALFTLNPLTIGYSGLLVVDMAHTGAALLCLYLLWRFVQRPTILRCALTAVGLGVALATKYLAFFLFPPVIAIAAGQAFRARWRGEGGTAARGILAAAGASFAIPVLAIVTLHACYGFRVGCASTAAGDYRAELLRDAMEMPAVRPLVGRLPAPLLQGMDFHLDRVNNLPFEPYLDGRFAARFPSYYLRGFLYKTPEWMIALTIWLLLFRIPRWLRGRGSLAERSTLWIALPVVVILGGYFSLLSGQQEGVRYILPLYGLLMILLGSVGQASLLARLPRGAWAALVAAVALFHGWDLAANWPNLIGYYNLSAGGQGAAYRHFQYSNSEWGQYGETGLAALRQTEREPFEVLTADSGPRFGRVAIGLLQLTRRDPEDRTRTRHWLHAFTAVRHIGAAYWLFDVAPEEFERVVAEKDDPRVRADLAVAYLGGGRLEDARRHIALLPEERARPLDTLVTLRERSLAGPIDLPAMLALLDGLIGLGRFDVVGEVIASHPDHAVTEQARFPMFLASALWDSGQQEAAIEALEQRRDLGFAPASFLLARYYGEIFRYDEAIAVLERLPEQAPGVNEEKVRGMLAFLRAQQAFWESLRSALR